MMMKRLMPMTAMLAVFAAAPALAASCDAELTAIDIRVSDAATNAVAASGSGQGTAAKRNGQAIEARDAKVPVTALSKGPAAGSSEAHETTAAAQAGGSGDRVMQAKATINEARVAKGKGDEAGCLAATAKAKAQLDQ